MYIIGLSSKKEMIKFYAFRIVAMMTYQKIPRIAPCINKISYPVGSSQMTTPSEVSITIWTILGYISYPFPTSRYITAVYLTPKPKQLFLCYCSWQRPIGWHFTSPKKFAPADGHQEHRYGVPASLGANKKGDIPDGTININFSSSFHKEMAA